MVAREVYHYTDKRGDTITYKFDPSLIYDREDGPLSVYHVWVYESRKTIQWSSLLLNKADAAARWAADKKPMIGLVLWKGMLGGRPVVVRFTGFERGAKGFVVEFQGRFIK